MPNGLRVIVVGLGGMGSAAAFELARRGHQVLGLEQYEIPHERGSSHGLTRIIRLAYFEHPSYVPLLRRAYTLWRELEREAGESLLHTTGSIDASTPDGPIFTGSRDSCLAHDLPHEILSARDVARRFPGYRLPADYRAVFQPDGGFLVPERAIEAYVALAQRRGATIRSGSRVLDWRSTPEGGICVRTASGAHEADALVLTAGPWIGTLLPDLARVAVPERQVVAWFRPARPALFEPARFPVFNLLVPEGHFYGFPVHGLPGFKIGRYHHRGQRWDPDAPDRSVDAEDERILREATARYFPEAAGETIDMKVCLFTNSPDEHFIVDRLPGPPVYVAAGFSGHGYKFSSVIGEILAHLVTDGTTSHDVGWLRLSRWAGH